MFEDFQLRYSRGNHSGKQSPLKMLKAICAFMHACLHACLCLDIPAVHENKKLYRHWAVGYQTELICYLLKSAGVEKLHYFYESTEFANLIFSRRNNLKKDVTNASGNVSTQIHSQM